MASYLPPKKNTEFIFYIGLTSQFNTKLFQVNPTLAAGDVKVSLDGGPFNNLATLPVVTPASGTMVKVTLSASEMNADNINITFSDVAGNEWCDLSVNIQTSTNQIDALSTAAALATVQADTDDLQTKIGTPTGVSVAADIADVEGKVDDLEGRLTDTRAGYLDNLSAGAVTLESTAQSILADTDDIQAKIGTPTGGSVSADLADIESKVDDLEGRLTTLRAGYLDNLSAGAVALEATAQSIVTATDDLEGRLTAVRAAYLDNLSGGAVALQSTATEILADTDDLQTKLGTPTGISFSADLADIESKVDDLEGRLTDLRAGYLDNLSGGAVALESTAVSIQADTDDLQTKLGTPVGTSFSADLADIESKVDDLEGRLTELRAGYLDNLSAGATALESTAQSVLADTDDLQTKVGTPTGASVSADLADIESKVDDLEGRLTALRAGYLDNLSAGAAALESTAQSILADTGTDGVALTVAERNAVADALLDRVDAIEVGLTFRQAVAIMAAALAGKPSGLPGLTPIFRNAVADSKNRISATVDADGNRLTITYDLT